MSSLSVSQPTETTPPWWRSAGQIGLLGGIITVSIALQE
jgi:hypothetical protein